MRLEAQDIVKRFGEVTVLDGVSLVAEPGKVTGLIGPNGSGKSTLFDTITGVVPRDAGTVRLDAEVIEGGLADFARRGLVRTFQVPRLGRRLTVLENLMLAAPDGAGESVLRLLSPWHRRRVREDELARRDAALAMLAELGLEHLAEEYAGVLSGGQQKLLTLGIVLMLDPPALLLDEPTAGVNPTLIERILELLKARCTAGRTTLIIEHNIPAIASLCETVYVLDVGRIIARGTPTEVSRDERVIDAYLGRRHAERSEADA